MAIALAFGALKKRPRSTGRTRHGYRCPCDRCMKTAPCPERKAARDVYDHDVRDLRRAFRSLRMGTDL